MQAAIIKPIIEQHAEEAAFLWLLRNAAVHAPHYSLKDLAELDDRVDAHLDGLRIAGEAAWEICQEALAIEEPGEVFTAALFAFEGNDGQNIKGVRVIDISSLPDIPLTSCHLLLPEVRHVCPFLYPDKQHSLCR